MPLEQVADLIWTALSAHRSHTVTVTVEKHESNALGLILVGEGKPFLGCDIGYPDQQLALFKAILDRANAVSQFRTHGTGGVVDLHYRGRSIPDSAQIAHGFATLVIGVQKTTDASGTEDNHRNDPKNTPSPTRM